MKNNASDRLNESIRILETKQAIELQQLKEQAYQTVENIKPINLIKSVYKNLSSSPQVHTSLLQNAIGLTTGYLSKKIVLGSSHNPVKKILGTVLQVAVGNLMSNHSDTIISTAGYLVNKITEFRNRKKNSQQHTN